MNGVIWLWNYHENITTPNLTSFSDCIEVYHRANYDMVRRLFQAAVALAHCNLVFMPFFFFLFKFIFYFSGGRSDRLLATAFTISVLLKFYRHLPVELQRPFYNYARCIVSL